MFGSVGNIGNLGKHTRGLAAILYLLRATFTRADTGALANGTVLSDTQLPVTTGSLTVVDTSTGTVEVLGNQLKIVGSGLYNETSVYSTAPTKAIGNTLMLSMVSASGQLSVMGFCKAATPTLASDQGIWFSSTTINYILNNTFNAVIGASTYGQTYQIALVQGGYDVNGVAYKNGDTKANFTYGLQYFVKGGTEYPAWTLLWRENRFADALPIADINHSTGTNTFDNLRIPNSDLSAVLQPTVLDTFTDTNGTALTSHTSDVGAGAYSFPVGTSDIQSNQANCVTQTANESSFVKNAGLSDGVFSITSLQSAGSHGLIFRQVDSTNYWLAYVVATAFRIYEVTAGTSTQRATIAYTKTNNDVITVITDGTSITAFVNGANKLSYTSSVRQTATIVGGYFGNAVGSRFDNLSVFPRTSASQYDNNFDATPSSYLLNAPFDSPNEPLYNGQVLNQDAEGVEEGSLTVVDPSIGTVEVLGNALSIFGTNTWNTGIVSGVVPRSIGICCIIKGVTPQVLFGFMSAQSITPTSNFTHSTILLQATLLSYYPGSIPVGVSTGGVSYAHAFVLGGYDVNGVAYKSGDTKSNFTYGAAYFVRGGTEYPVWTLLWKDSASNTADMYVGINKLTNNTSTFDDIRIPDSDLSAVLQPTVLDTFTDTNGTALTAHTSDVGAGAWTVPVGSFNIQSNKASAGTGGISRAVKETGLSNLILKGTIGSIGNNGAGLLFRYVDDSNHWILWHDSTTFYLIEVTAAANDVRASTAHAFTTGDKLSVICDGTTISGFVNGGSKLTYTSSVHQSGTKCGIRGNSTSGNPTIDNLACFPRTSATYESQFGGV